MHKEKISVIIPTVNAYEELDLALTSIDQNSDNEIELIVVVDPDKLTGKINDQILAVCSKHKVKPFKNSHNLGPYGNWNRGVELATTDWLVFATDDQYFAPHWDGNLLKYHQPKRLVAGRLVEPGIIPVWRTNIKKDFGVVPGEFREEEFIDWCNSQKTTGFVNDGFFIPMLQSRRDFKALGGYQVKGDFGTAEANSSDVLYVQEALKKGYEFGTASDSYSYHFQASSWKKKNLKPTIAAVILTLNEEADLPRALASLRFVDKVIVIDSGSTDGTVSVSRKYKAEVIKHQFKSYADQRNYALTQAQGYDWVLMIDADEIVEPELINELQFVAKDIYVDGVMIPRKNHIFGRFIEHTDWYPDLRMVFFRPKLVKFVADVHERAVFVKGNGNTVNAVNHIIHNNYVTVSEFIEKNLVRYPQIYAKVLDDKDTKFAASDLLVEPISEFMRRFFLAAGYKDGLFGLVLSLLMGAQTLVAYIFLWELQGKRANLTSSETQAVFNTLSGKSAELKYWLRTIRIDSSTGVVRLFHRAHRKALKWVKGL